MSSSIMVLSIWHSAYIQYFFQDAKAWPIQGFPKTDLENWRSKEIIYAQITPRHAFSWILLASGGYELRLLAWSLDLMTSLIGLA